jgi:hypothetical protein
MIGHDPPPRGSGQADGGDSRADAASFSATGASGGHAKPERLDTARGGVYPAGIRMSSKDTYILLHKAKGNVGDLLIIERARELLGRVRPDRKCEVWDREVAFTDEHLERVAGAAALILCGGPGYQPAAYPNVYPLHPDLGRIAAPIFGFGVGWKGVRGDWSEAASYRWSDATQRLFARMECNASPSSCRDYLTVSALKANGFANHTMTGCPTWYPDGEPGFIEPRSALRLAYTPGALTSARREYVQLELAVLERLREHGAGGLTVLFHHPTTREAYERHYSAKAWGRYVRNLQPLLDHLRDQGIPWVDLSADLEKMKRTYAEYDLHVGFRVHAHLYFLSGGKPSVLIAEDGRGRGVLDALPSLGFAAADLRGRGWLGRIASLSPGTEGVPGLAAAVESEISQGYPRSRRALESIRATFPRMKSFLEGLP